MHSDTAAIKAIVRSSGDGLEAALSHPIDHSSSSSNRGGWSNNAVSSRDTSVTFELRQCEEVARVLIGALPSTTSHSFDALLHDATNEASLSITLTPSIPRRSFPTACICSVTSVGQREGEVQMKDVVIREWVLIESRLTPNTFSTQISVRTLRNISSLVNGGVDTSAKENSLSPLRMRQLKGSQTPRVFLTLRFVGCCDQSDSHAIAALSLSYVFSSQGKEMLAEAATLVGGSFYPQLTPPHPSSTISIAPAADASAQQEQRGRGASHHSHQRAATPGSIPSSVDVSQAVDLSAVVHQSSQQQHQYQYPPSHHRAASASPAASSSSHFSTHHAISPSAVAVADEHFEERGGSHNAAAVRRAGSSAERSGTTRDIVINATVRRRPLGQRHDTAALLNTSGGVWGLGHGSPQEGDRSGAAHSNGRTPATPLMEHSPSPSSAAGVGVSGGRWDAESGNSLLWNAHGVPTGTTSTHNGLQQQPPRVGLCEDSSSSPAAAQMARHAGAYASPSPSSYATPHPFSGAPSSSMTPPSGGVGLAKSISPPQRFTTYAPAASPGGMDGSVPSVAPGALSAAATGRSAFPRAPSVSKDARGNYTITAAPPPPSQPSSSLASVYADEVGVGSDMVNISIVVPCGDEGEGEGDGYGGDGYGMSPQPVAPQPYAAHTTPEERDHHHGHHHGGDGHSPQPTSTSVTVRHYQPLAQMAAFRGSSGGSGRGSLSLGGARAEGFTTAGGSVYGGGGGASEEGQHRRAAAIHAGAFMLPSSPPAHSPTVPPSPVESDAPIISNNHRHQHRDGRSMTVDRSDSNSIPRAGSLANHFRGDGAHHSVPDHLSPPPFLKPSTRHPSVAVGEDGLGDDRHHHHNRNRNHEASNNGDSADHSIATSIGSRDARLVALNRQLAEARPYPPFPNGSSHSFAVADESAMDGSPSMHLGAGRSDAQPDDGHSPSHHSFQQQQQRRANAEGSPAAEYGNGGMREPAVEEGDGVRHEDYYQKARHAKQPSFYVVGGGAAHLQMGPGTAHAGGAEEEEEEGEGDAARRSSVPRSSPSAATPPTNIPSAVAASSSHGLGGGGSSSPLAAHYYDKEVSAPRQRREGLAAEVGDGGGTAQAAASATSHADPYRRHDDPHYHNHHNSLDHHHDQYRYHADADAVVMVSAGTSPMAAEGVRGHQSPAHAAAAESVTLVASSATQTSPAAARAPPAPEHIPLPPPCAEKEGTIIDTDDQLPLLRPAMGNRSSSSRGGAAFLVPNLSTFTAVDGAGQGLGGAGGSSARTAVGHPLGGAVRAARESVALAEARRSTSALEGAGCYAPEGDTLWLAAELLGEVAHSRRSPSGISSNGVGGAGRPPVNAKGGASARPSASLNTSRSNSSNAAAHSQFHQKQQQDHLYPVGQQQQQQHGGVLFAAPSRHSFVSVNSGGGGATLVNQHSAAAVGPSCSNVYSHQQCPAPMPPAPSFATSHHHHSAPLALHQQAHEQLVYAQQQPSHPAILSPPIPPPPPSVVPPPVASHDDQHHDGHHRQRQQSSPMEPLFAQTSVSKRSSSSAAGGPTTAAESSGSPPPSSAAVPLPPPAPVTAAMNRVPAVDAPSMGIMVVPGRFADSLPQRSAAGNTHSVVEHNHRHYDDDDGRDSYQQEHHHQLAHRAADSAGEGFAGPAADDAPPSSPPPAGAMRAVGGAHLGYDDHPQQQQQYFAGVQSHSTMEQLAAAHTVSTSGGPSNRAAADDSAAAVVGASDDGGGGIGGGEASVWCLKHHARSVGTARRIIDMRQCVDVPSSIAGVMAPRVLLCMRHIDGKLWKEGRRSRSPFSSSSGGGGGLGHPSPFIELTEGTCVLIGERALQDEAIHTEHVRDARRCVVIRQATRWTGAGSGNGGGGRSSSSRSRSSSVTARYYDSVVAAFELTTAADWRLVTTILRPFIPASASVEELQQE